MHSGSSPSLHLSEEQRGIIFLMFRLGLRSLCRVQHNGNFDWKVEGACHYSATVLARSTLAPTLQRLPTLAPVTLARPEARHGVLAPARSSFQRQDLKKEYKRTQFFIGRTIDGDYYCIKTTILILQ